MSDQEPTMEAATSEKKATRKRRRARRGRDEGSVWQRPDGLWACRVSDGYDGNGKRRRFTAYGTTKQKALSELAKLKGQSLTGTLLDPSRVTVAQFLADWIEASKASWRPATLAHHEGIIRLHINPFLGGFLLRRLQSTTIEGFYRRLQVEGRSARMVQMVGTLLYSAMKRAKKHKLITSNPADDADRPRATKRESKVLDAEQALAFLDAAKADRLEALYVLALGVGMRQGELLGLQWHDLDLKAGTLSVERQLCEVAGKLFLAPPKTKKGQRQIELPAFVVAALKGHRERAFAEGHAGPDAFVFCDHPRGKVKRGDGPTLGAIRKSNLRRRSFEPILARARVCNVCASHAVKVIPATDDVPGCVDCLTCGRTEGATLPRVRFHDLRHSSATLLLKMGVHPSIVQQMLGHSRVGITLDTYSHVLPAMSREAASKMDDVLGQR